MPAPNIFDQGAWDPFTDRDPIKDIPHGGMLYATDREPDREKGGYYLDDRGHVELDQDYRLYEEALQKMKDGVDPGDPAEDGAAVSAEASEDMQQLKVEIEERRERLVEAFAAL
jgi:hypothetical protein